MDKITDPLKIEGGPIHLPLLEMGHLTRLSFCLPGYTGEYAMSSAYEKLKETAPMEISFRTLRRALNQRIILSVLMIFFVACSAFSSTPSTDISALLSTPTTDISRFSLSQLAVYVSGGGHTVYALRASDGKQLWSSQIHGSAAGLTLVSGALFVNQDGGVSALRARDGQELWSHQDGQFAYGDCFLASLTIVIYCANNNDTGLTDGHVLRTSDGSELWQETTFASAGETEWVEISGVLYNVDGTVTAIEEATGNQLWQFGYSKLADPVRPAVVGTTIYVNGEKMACMHWTWPAGKFFGTLQQA